ncbi:protein root UVB sensitive 4 isoform X1 [Physcomitrium patens]|uniref:protein root UVB sensitive 4 isoform X1 n=1 Tax=Physcomitrium patens TaxID=3218 RepID=UPI000D155896|nr:protein root UVB sensitive 4-like isoform X1 [Physcomitrium patens]XP_024392219.1 protein root UVB sensitive 4-like isoform X1 [Physcomitrium patens]XP_024392220.1 protein root UVB sensitive 4-like isoform X1 [Physcomitrium patens]|eukprot:XP_024392218.1 protein root UVB sensitive 4-like isoform X1 [Physcomitrella patens]
MVTTSSLAPGWPGSLVSVRSSQCLYGSSRHLRLGHKRQKSSAALTDNKRCQCRCFVEEVSHAWKQWRGWRKSSRPYKDGKKLPVVIFEGGRQWQYVFDGEQIRAVEFDGVSLQNGEARNESVSGQVAGSVLKLRQTLQRIFVPDQVWPHYLVYLKWKLVHRFLSSVLHFQCTQAMLWAVGVGAKRRLPAAAALNWVMKDGVGRLGKLLFTANFGRTFDSDLKRVRFWTSVLFSSSVGLEILTPLFPQHFLLLATLANIAKSIAYAAYLATSSAIHRSFALGDNLADISAKGMAQTVVADNLGLAAAVCLSQFIHNFPKIEKFLPLAMYPVLASAELFAIYQQLQAVHLQTLNKERLEIIINIWVKDRRIPSFEEVSKIENVALLDLFREGGSGFKNQLSLRIGAVSLRYLTPEGLMNIVNLRETQKYTLCLEPHFSSPFRGHLSLLQPRLLLWLNEKATTEDIIMGVLQACHIRTTITSKASLEQLGIQYEKGDVNGRWRNLLLESRTHAEVDFKPLLDAIKDGGWITRRILLSPKEQCSFSILNN